SIHTSIVFTTAFILSVYHPKKWWLFLGVSLLTGVSRIIVGVNYLNDVLIGAGIGFTIGLFIIRYRKRICRI
ncbi:unnamed protein product, partial [marine sediment metagenome]